MAPNPSNPSPGPSLSRQLLGYSIAAGAALSLARPADAEVIYHSANITLNQANPVVCIDLNDDSVCDFVFGFKYEQGYYRGLLAASYPFYYEGSEKYYNAMFGEEYVTFYGLVSNLCSRSVPTDDPLLLGVLNVQYYGGGPFYGLTYGNFIGERGHLGVVFTIPNGPDDFTQHAGWIEYEGAADGSWGRITGWAYETEPETAINTPACDIQAESVPTLNQWGLLILMGLILAEGTRRLSRRETAS